MLMKHFMLYQGDSDILSQSYVSSGTTLDMVLFLNQDLNVKKMTNSF